MAYEVVKASALAKLVTAAVTSNAALQNAVKLHAKGDPGADGAPGPKGDTGPKGDKGDKGDPGTASVVPRSAVTASSPAADVRPYLPSPVRKASVKAYNIIQVGTSTQWPTPVTGLRQNRVVTTRVQNLSSSDSLNVGTGTYNNPNHSSEPNVVPAGSEFVNGADRRPIFARYTTTENPVMVITEYGGVL